MVVEMLLGRDEFAMNYNKYHRAQEKKAAAYALGHPGNAAQQKRLVPLSC